MALSNEIILLEEDTNNAKSKKVANTINYLNDMLNKYSSKIIDLQNDNEQLLLKASNFEDNIEFLKGVRDKLDNENENNKFELLRKNMDIQNLKIK